MITYSYLENITLLYTTKDRVNILGDLGNKSPSDFVIRYQEPGKRVRTPKHIHWIIDLYIKHAQLPAETMILVEHLIDVTQRVMPITYFPPKLQIFHQSHLDTFKSLDGVGYYSVEFLLVVIELIMIQEVTNYPKGSMNLDLLRAFRNDPGDIFHVVSRATFR